MECGGLTPLLDDEARLVAPTTLRKLSCQPLPQNSFKPPPSPSEPPAAKPLHFSSNPPGRVGTPLSTAQRRDHQCQRPTESTPSLRQLHPFARQDSDFRKRRPLSSIIIPTQPPRICLIELKSNSVFRLCQFGYPIRTRCTLYNCHALFTNSMIFGL